MHRRLLLRVTNNLVCIFFLLNFKTSFWIIFLRNIPLFPLYIGECFREVQYIPTTPLYIALRYHTVSLSDIVVSIVSCSSSKIVAIRFLSATIWSGVLNGTDTVWLDWIFGWNVSFFWSCLSYSKSFFSLLLYILPILSCKDFSFSNLAWSLVAQYLYIFL